MSQERTERPFKGLAIAKSLLSVVVVIALLIGGFWGSHFWAPSHSSDMPHDAAAEMVLRPEAVVSLSPRKQLAAEIRVVAVERRAIQPTRTVAATIDYARPQQLLLSAPVDSVVTGIHVKTGDVVEAGQRLVTLSSAQVALARSEVKKGESDVQLARIEYERMEETHGNLGRLLTALRDKPAIASLQSQFQNVSLGEYRDELLTSYSEFVLANKNAARTVPLRGVIAERTADERISKRDVSENVFKAACEQTEYESRSHLARSKAQLEAAVRGQGVSRERLRLLLGPFGDESISPERGEFGIRARFGGRIETINTVVASRLQKGVPILLLADTKTLWVTALVHQHQWDALELSRKAPLRVTVPALPGRSLEATVLFVGAKVSADTRAIPIVATVDNRKGTLRPGMFAWVSLPASAPRHGLAVPPSAIQRHEGQDFVFVSQSKAEFRRVVVTIGSQSPEYVEITDGLSPADRVVDQGAFYLMSELLLMGDEE